MESLETNLRQAACDVIACLRFYSRLPIPPLPFERQPFAMLDFSRAIVMLPVAGGLIGAIGGLALVVASKLHLPPLIAAILGVAALVLATGAMHEDGLADTADGFGGGATVARKLDIMRDSRIGSYGGAALVLSLLLRVAALDNLAGQGVLRAALVMVAVAAVSRTLGLLPLVLLPPARSDGAAFSAARPSPQVLARALGLACLVALLPMAAGLSLQPLVTGVFCAGLAAWAVTGLSKCQIGGQTGDVAGSAQQVAEIAFLLAVVGETAV